MLTSLNKNSESVLTFDVICTCGYLMYEINSAAHICLYNNERVWLACSCVSVIHTCT